MIKQDLTDATFLHQYSMSLHWALSQFAGGMDEITPANVEERVFAIAIFNLAFVLASCFVSLVTSSMTKMCLMVHQRLQQIADLRRYLSQNKISKQLTMRVQRNALKTASAQQRFTPESSVYLLKLISDQLRAELHFELYTPILGLHAIFANLQEHCPPVLRRVCHLAVSMMTCHSGDVLFSCGELPQRPCMYFVCWRPRPSSASWRPLPFRRPCWSSSSSTMI